MPLPPPLAIATNVAPPFRVFREISVQRAYGPQFYGYGFHHTDEAAYPWLAFTAITLGVLNLLNENQVRYHEEAQIVASSAPIGETIVWENGAAQGYVTPTRQGVDRYGNTCREFHHYVYIEGSEEEVYGTACRDSNGVWRHVS
ncbi:MAG: hypothetical protein QNI84_11620 [Henriciella sp.]|nr:hypothetical protein [Henriciella sp.]